MKKLLPPLLILVLLILNNCAPAPSADPQLTLNLSSSTTSVAKTNSVQASPSPQVNTTAIPMSSQIVIQTTSVTLENETSPAPSPSITVTETKPQLQKTALTSGTPTPSPTIDPENWQDLPVVPAISDKVLQIYLDGLELGNNPKAFSKIGDCGSTPAWFLGDFDRGSRYYRLGDYAQLQNVIDYFQGSYDRTSLAARSGFNVSALFVPLWADRTFCESDESPLHCEYRLHKPIIAFIMLGTNDVWHPQEFEPQMRKLIEYSIENGVIPILSTKADNQEGDGSINATIARLAMEYQIPLWNFWKAANQLPDQGLQEDRVHLTWGANFFDRPQSLLLAWPVRNLTALQVLDAVWQKISEH